MRVLLVIFYTIALALGAILYLMEAPKVKSCCGGTMCEMRHHREIEVSEDWEW